MPHDARILQESLDVVVAESSHQLEVEPDERTPEVVALVQDGQPAKARLEALEADLLEQPPVVVDRKPPLVVVVVDVALVGATPPAARLTMMRQAVVGHGCSGSH